MRVSTSDLVAPVGMTLFTGAQHAGAWRDAAAASTFVPVAVVEIGGELTDPAGLWASVSGTGPDGAFLVRPDRHVAWRAATMPAEPCAELTAVLRRLLHPSAPPQTVAGDLAGITEAGESLRTTSSRSPQLFTVAE
jgi:2,4-dichlorophenol 6-monooxygenase